MSVLADTTGSVVDMVFPVAGNLLPRDHAAALQRAVCELLPWLADDAAAGIHAIKLVPGLAAKALVPGRARLILRVGGDRTAELAALGGAELQVGGHGLRLGSPHARPLLPHGTLYAYKVAASSSDEVAFMAEVDEELAALGVGGERVCGKRQRVAIEDGILDTFSLMLHALAPEQSLRLQERGVGPHRLMGCGIFVPHKSAAAVGA